MKLCLLLLAGSLSATHASLEPMNPLAITGQAMKEHYSKLIAAAVSVSGQKKLHDGFMADVAIPAQRRQLMAHIQSPECLKDCEGAETLPWDGVTMCGRGADNSKMCPHVKKWTESACMIDCENGKDDEGIGHLTMAWEKVCK